MTMNKPKSIQIDFDLFLDLVEYFFNDGDEYLANDIQKALESKIDRIIAHQKFSQYKRAPQGEERERLRQEYLDHIGMFKSYRTDTEWHEPEPEEPPTETTNND